MNNKLLFPILCLVLLSLLSSGCTNSYVKESPTMLYEASQFYFPINQTQKLLPKWPDREYETDVTIEGIGWQDDHFFIVMKTQVLTAPLGAEDLYSTLSKRFSPTVIYKGQRYPLKDLQWEEGSPIIYRHNVYRYAYRLPADFLPEGAIPTTIKVNELTFELPKQVSKSHTLPGNHVLEASVGSIPKAVEDDELLYQVTSFESHEGAAQLTLNVESKADNIPESLHFLLRDDLNRIFSVTNDVAAYHEGKNTLILRVNERLPGDIKHLSLLLFQSKGSVASIHEIINEAEIKIF